MSSLFDQMKNLGFQVTEESNEESSESSPENPRQSHAVKIQRQTKGRKGKGVTVLTELDVDANTLQDYAKALRKTCGVGGSVKNGTIELQGDQRESAKAWLEARGYKAKLAGG